MKSISPDWTNSKSHYGDFLAPMKSLYFKDPLPDLMNLKAKANDDSHEDLVSFRDNSNATFID